MEELPTLLALTTLAEITGGEHPLMGELLIRLYKIPVQQYLPPNEVFRKFRALQSDYSEFQTVVGASVALSVLYIDLIRRAEFKRMAFTYGTETPPLDVIELRVSKSQKEVALLYIPRVVEEGLVCILQRMNLKHFDSQYVAAIGVPCTQTSLKTVELFL